jgi:hypothetical protein
MGKVIAGSSFEHEAKNIRLQIAKRGAILDFFMAVNVVLIRSAKMRKPLLLLRE